jgi:hypothetical protein
MHEDLQDAQASAPISEMSEERVVSWLGLFQALGFVVVHWGLIERQIDNWVGRLFLNFRGKEMRPKGDVPVFLKQKARFLSDCFKQIPELAELQPIAKSLIARIETVSKKRNDLIHGSINSLEPDNGVFSFDKIDYLPQQQNLREFTASHADFQELLPVLTDLLVESIQFSQKLLAIPPRSQE